MKKSKLKKTGVQEASRPDAFAMSTRTLLSELVSATNVVVSHFRSSAKTSADFSRLLGIPKKAAWQFYRIAGCTDPLVAANFVPGDKPMSDLIEIARREGVSEKTVAKLEQAYQSFDQFVNRVAGDRSTFLAMLADTSRDPDASADLDRQHRIQVFKSLAHFYGMYAGCSADITFVEETVPGQRTEVEMRTLSGFCRLRTDAQCVVERHALVGQVDEVPLQPLDAKAFKEHGVPVLPAFCSKPMPTLIVDYHEPNARVIEWAGDSVGADESVDVTTGIVRRHSYSVPTDNEEHGIRHRTVVGYPVKRMTQTWLLHLPQSFDLLPPRLKSGLNPQTGSLAEGGKIPRSTRSLYGDAEFFPARSWSRLPNRFAGIREQVVYTCALMRWDPNDFAIVNLEIDYPLVNSVVLVEMPWKNR